MCAARSSSSGSQHPGRATTSGRFGPDMVKIGMTRRLDPAGRVRELGDASVPFHYDVHAVDFSNDAVSLETRLHHTFADRWVNPVNTRRDFFRVSPGEVRDVLLAGLDATIVNWADEPEALEYRQSETTRRQAGPHHPRCYAANAEWPACQRSHPGRTPATATTPKQCHHG